MQMCLWMTKREVEGSDAANDELPLSCSLSLSLPPVKTKSLFLFSPLLRSLFYTFVLFTHLSLCIYPRSCFSLFITVFLSLPFCYLQNIPCLIVAEMGYFEQTGSRIDIQIILLGEMTGGHCLSSLMWKL